MNGEDQQYRASAEGLDQLSGFLYGRSHVGSNVALGDIYRALAPRDPGDIDHLIQLLSDEGLLMADFRRDRVKLQWPGKDMYERRCIPELVLGLAYCDWKFRGAVVRISVRTSEGVPAAGTGFFVDEPQDCIVTNRHVVHGNTITRVDDQSGSEVVRVPENAVEVAADEDLDLALIHVAPPRGINLLRIDWTEDGGTLLEQVLIMGYPYIALHHPALLHSRGEISLRARQLGGVDRSPRESLMISHVTAPGCSGGPVISSKGLVVGVVTSEQTTERAGTAPETFVRATPSFHLLGLPTLASH